MLLNEQTLRYGELSERLPMVSHKVLATELKELVSLGVMNRVAYAEMPPRVEYTLTEKGRLMVNPSSASADTTNRPILIKLTICQ